MNSIKQVNICVVIKICTSNGNLSENASCRANERTIELIFQLKAPPMTGADCESNAFITHVKQTAGRQKDRERERERDKQSGVAFMDQEAVHGLEALQLERKRQILPQVPAALKGVWACGSPRRGALSRRVARYVSVTSLRWQQSVQDPADALVLLHRIFWRIIGRARLPGGGDRTKEQTLTARLPKPLFSRNSTTNSSRALLLLCLQLLCTLQAQYVVMYVCVMRLWPKKTRSERMDLGSLRSQIVS